MKNKKPLLTKRIFTAVKGKAVGTYVAIFLIIFFFAIFLKIKILIINTVSLFLKKVNNSEPKKIFVYNRKLRQY